MKIKQMPQSREEALEMFEAQILGSDGKSTESTQLSNFSKKGPARSMKTASRMVLQVESK